MISTCEFWESTNTQPLTCPLITTIYSSFLNSWVEASHTATSFPASHILSQGKSKKKSEVTQSCPTLCDPIDCSLPFSRKSNGLGCHFLLQRIFPTQGSNPGLPRCWQMLYHLSHLLNGVWAQVMRVYLQMQALWLRLWLLSTLFSIFTCWNPDKVDQICRY